MKKIIIGATLALVLPVLLTGCDFSDAGQGEPPRVAFNAVTLDGETVSESIFAEYDLTMINIWATYCEPCIEEMPELQELYGQLPENVNMITICWDGEEDPALTREIYDYAGGTFRVLFPDEGLTKGYLSSVGAVPTTIFVDKDGNTVGEAQVGTPGLVGEGVLVDAYLQLISDHLAQLDKE